jgi:hypothetical protein
VLKYCAEIGRNTSTNYKCLVDWKDNNKSQSWVNFFASCLSNPTVTSSVSKKSIVQSPIIANAAKVMTFAYVKSEKNVSDIPIKPLIMKDFIIWSRIGCSVFLRFKNERYIYMIWILR